MTRLYHIPYGTHILSVVVQFCDVERSTLSLTIILIILYRLSFGFRDFQIGGTCCRPAVVLVFDLLRDLLFDLSPRLLYLHEMLFRWVGFANFPTANGAIEHAVKSGRLFYYMCGNARRKGREVCKTPLLPKDKIEEFVIDRIKQYILTEENLEELVRLTNEELAQTCD